MTELDAQQNANKLELLQASAEAQELSEEEMADIINAFQPRIVEPYFRETPTPIQQIALSLYSREMLFGGAAGGGKSSFLLMAALQFVDVPGYSALILRRTWPDLNAPNAILSRFKDWMAPFTGKGEGKVEMRDQGRLWIFPSGAKISFGYVARPDQMRKFAGGEYSFIGWDELTHFEEEVYTFLFSRVRKPQLSCISCRVPLEQRRSSTGKAFYQHVKGQGGCDYPLPDPQVLSLYPPAEDGLSIFDVPLRVISTSNPGGIGHEWVKRRLVEGKIESADKPVYIPANMYDNPHLNHEEYYKSLAELGAVERERLLNSNWDVMPAGYLFERGQFTICNGLDGNPDPIKPTQCKHLVRSWDLAATESNSADYTVGTLCGITTDNKWVVLDVKRVRKRPALVESLVLQTANEDGKDVRIVMEQEPGSGGKSQISHYGRNILPGFMFKGVRATGSKETRAEIMSAQAGINNVYLNPGTWNQEWLNEVAAFPKGAHDDQVDSAVNGFDSMANKRVRILA